MLRSITVCPSRVFFFSSRRRHTRWTGDWSSDVCSSDLGGPAELRNLAARLFAQRLDRARPLWEEWLLEGLADGRWAIISKVHHAMVDGVGGTDLMTLVFDQTPDAAHLAPAAWDPELPPSLASMIADGVRDAISWPFRQLAMSPDIIALIRAPAAL